MALPFTTLRRTPRIHTSMGSIKSRLVLALGIVQLMTLAMALLL
jgi:hypothetical protein